FGRFGGGLPQAAVRRAGTRSRRGRSRSVRTRNCLLSGSAKPPSNWGQTRPRSGWRGVYAMASLADDWEQGRQMCIDVLRAYLRMPYTPPAEPNSNGSGDGDAEADGVDEQTQRARLEERQVRHTIIRIITQ